TDALAIDRASRVWLFAFGKAAQPMAAAAVASLLRSLHSIVGGVVVSQDGGPPPYPTLHSMRGDHPIPGRQSFAAAAKIGEVTPGRRGNDVAVVLVSGGASSLIAAPLRGMSEADLSLLFELLLGSGLDIGAVNAVRKRFSRWAAGRLALALAPAATYCLAMSDVAGDDLSVIGSGPCVPDSTTVRDVLEILGRSSLLSKLPQSYRDYLTGVAQRTIPETPTSSHPAFAHVTARVIGDNRLAVDGAAERARDRGLDVQVIDEPLAGDAARSGEEIAQHLISLSADGRGKPGTRCFVWGGETTVTLGGASSGGRPTGGGRCQELALAASRVLSDARNEHHSSSEARIQILAAGTDGRDGATDSAGAIVDETTWSAIAGAGRDPAQALAAHESHGALRAAGALIPRKDTGTNVNDVVIGIV
ncbi:MAG: glycerate kinase type-2 family protein, partial [Gemmatimonadaceae bacterium]